MEPAFQAGDGRPHHLFFLPHCAQRSGGPFYLIDSGRLTHRLPSSTPHLRRGPDGPWRLRRRDGAAWRYQRKIVGAKQLVILPEAKTRPDTPLSSHEAPSPSQNPPSKKKGFTGEHGSPVKSRAARDAVPHCISAEMPRLGVQGRFRASCRTVSIDAPGAFSFGPLQRPVLFSREKRMGGWRLFPLGR